jgi:glutamyl-Q tRNA(Asp) synthetase
MSEGAGRFAPSPTGPLHLGSLLTATASFLDARHRGAPWYLRFDDLDRPRNQTGAETTILRDLEAHGLHWDGPVRRQSSNIARYADALANLAEQGWLFPCTCTRQALRGAALYPGTCRKRDQPMADCAVRLRVDAATIRFDDLIQGKQYVDLAQAVGDFIVRRRDGIHAYALATAVDDGAADISRIIRGRDLLPLTAAQLLIMARLNLAPPTYGHLPLMVNAYNQKLSKQAHAAPLSLTRPLDNLRQVLAALGNPAATAAADSCPELLKAAQPCWSLADIPRHDVPEPS